MVAKWTSHDGQAEDRITGSDGNNRVGSDRFNEACGTSEARDDFCGGSGGVPLNLHIVIYVLFSTIDALKLTSGQTTHLFNKDNDSAACFFTSQSSSRRK